MEINMSLQTKTIYRENAIYFNGKIKKICVYLVFTQPINVFYTSKLIKYKPLRLHEFRVILTLNGSDFPKQNYLLYVARHNRILYLEIKHVFSPLFYTKTINKESSFLREKHVKVKTMDVYYKHFKHI